MEKIRSKRGLIVGLDPGTTSGIAILDLNMKPILFTSVRGANRDAIVKAISELGEPILVACDVAQAPELVRKVTSLFNASLFTPKRDMTTNQKRRIVEEHLPSLPKGLDAHTIDALAAALKAYLGFKSKFESIEARLRKFLKPETIENIRSEIVKGVRLTHIISREIGRLEDESNERVVKVYIRDKEGGKRTEPRDTIERSIKLLRWENKKLKAELKDLKEERDNLEKNLKRRLSEDYSVVRKESLYRIQEKEITDLRHRLGEAEHRIVELTSRAGPQQDREISEGFIPLKEIPSFTYDDVEKATEEMGKDAHFLLLNAAGGGPSTAKKLAEARPRAVIRCTEMSHQAEDVLAEQGIPVISSNDLDVKYLKGTPTVEKRVLKEKIKEYSRSREESIITELLKSIKDKGAN